MGTAPTSFSKDFAIDTSILAPGSSAKVSIAASTDANALAAIFANDKFPSGKIELGHIALQASTGSGLAFKAGGTSVNFKASADFQTGVGIYDVPADALATLHLQAPASLDLAIPGAGASRYLLMQWGYDVAASVSGSHPIGVLGSASFGVDAKHDAVYAVLHRFDGNTGAHTVLADTISSWRLPRHVAFAAGEVNLKPGTWVLAEVDGSVAIKLAAQLGYNVTFTKEAKLLGLSRQLGAKIDAGLKATFGFSASGKYIVVAGRESADPASAVVRLRLFKQSLKGLDFGLNLTVGVTGQVPLPDKFDDFVQALFGVHGAQVVNDLHVFEQLTDPTKDLGDTIARLTNKTALDLLQRATGLNPATEFNKARGIVLDALNQWYKLPDRLSGMLWSFLGKQTGATVAGQFKTFLTALSNHDAKKRSEALAKAIQSVTFGDTPQGQFLEAIADKGLLALGNDLDGVSSIAAQTLSVLDGGVIGKLQGFINEKLNLDTIRKAVSDNDFNKVDEWLIKRLADFLDKQVLPADLKDIQKAIFAVDQKARDIYAQGLKALKTRYSVDFAATYQRTTTDTALLDVNFDLSKPEAQALFQDVAGGSNLDGLLVTETAGVTLNKASLSHEIKRTGTVDLHMPFFDFTGTHVNDSIATLTTEEHAGRVLVYQIKATDTETVKSRFQSQLSVLGSLRISAGQPLQLASGGTVAYETLQVKKDMRPLDLQQRTNPFIHNYLSSLFKGGDASILSFLSDFDNAVTAALHNQSNHLGDMALSMQVSMPANVLAGWFTPRSKQQLHDDKTRMSRRLQGTLKRTLPVFYFQDLDNVQMNTPAAALLVWSCLPVSTSINLDSGGVLHFNTDKEVFWDHPSVDLRRAVARDAHTLATLGAVLSGLQARLREAGRDAQGFEPGMAGRFVEMALNTSTPMTGDALLSGLLFTESQMVRGAADALDAIQSAVSQASTAPTEAIKKLAEYAADLTDTFNHRLSSVYGNDSLRTLGPLALLESSAAITPAFQTVTPNAMLRMYVLNNGHTFDIGTFLNGSMPPGNEVALTQTLVNLN